MKLAITGKGGVGKTTVAVLLARYLAEQGRRVVLIDADPDANTAAALGLDPATQPEPVRPAARSSVTTMQAYRTPFSPAGPMHAMPASEETYSERSFLAVSYVLNPQRSPASRISIPESPM